MLERSAIFYPACAVLLGSALLLRWLGLPFQTHDMQDFLLPWFEYIVTHGRFAALSDNFANYTPPYLYLLTLATYLDGLIDRAVLIKSVSMAFDFIGACVVFRIAVASGVALRRAALCALLFLNLPTLILNGAVWGQCDIIFVTFLLAFAFYLIRNRPFQALLMYGVALSIKVQAIFAAPFVVYLVLSGTVPVFAVVMLPLIYAILVLPAALAGRGWVSLLTIYADQAGIAQKLSARAPNFYLFVQHFLAPGLYPLAALVGLGLAGLVSVVVIATHFRASHQPKAVFIVTALALWLALEPSLLPKMHDRYFFGADVFSFVMAILIPRTWWIAVLFQIGSALSYSYFMMIDHPTPFDLHPASMVGALAAIPATLGVAWVYWREFGSQRPTAQSGPVVSVSGFSQGSALARPTKTKDRPGGKASGSK